MKEATSKTKKPATINFLDRDTWDARLAECVGALAECKEGSDEERLKGLEKVIGTMYPMYGLGVIKNLAGRAMEKFIKNRRVAEITQGIKVHFLSVWLDHDDWHDRRIALIGILGLIKEDIGIFNDVFFSQKDILEKEAREEIFLEAYGKIAKNLFYWKDLPEYSKGKEIKEKAKEVIDSYGKGRIAKRSYLILLSIVAEVFEKRSKEYDEAEKVRQAREAKIREEELAALKVEQMAREAERKEAKKREEEDKLRRQAEKNARKEQREREVNFAPMVILSNGKKAKVLPTTDHVMHISASQYAVVDEQIYLRTGNGVKKDEFLSIQKEAKPSTSVVASAVVSQKLPENLEELWVNKGQTTLKVHVVPESDLGNQQVQSAIKVRGYKYVAVKEGDSYKVYAAISMILLGDDFKKATNAQKHAQKRKLAASGKDFGEVIKDDAVKLGGFGEILGAAMRQKEVSAVAV